MDNKSLFLINLKLESYNNKKWNVYRVHWTQIIPAAN
jgi:hypothetical protein